MHKFDLYLAVVDFLAVALPPAVMFFHYQAGELRDTATGRKLKRMGTRAGVPDIGIIHDGRIEFIELKTDRGRLSAVQRACVGELEAAGARVAVCRSVEDVVAVLGGWGVPVRASVALS